MFSIPSSLTKPSTELPCSYQFVYGEKSNEHNAISHWDITWKVNEIVVERSGGLAKHPESSIFSRGWEMLRWQMGPIHLVKQEKAINGIRKGKAASCELGSMPWIQDLTFALKPFLLSKEKQLHFSVLNPKDLSKVDLIATKEGIEKVRVPMGTYKAIAVKISLDGWRKWFWSGVGHFSPKQGYMFRFESTAAPGILPLLKELQRIEQRTSSPQGN